MKLCGIPRSVICPDINCCLSSKLMLTLRGINEPENCVCGGGEGALTDFHIKAAATESVMIVAEVDKVHSASAKILTPSCQTFALLISLYQGNSMLLNRRN